MEGVPATPTVKKQIEGIDLYLTLPGRDITFLYATIKCLCRGCIYSAAPIRSAFQPDVVYTDTDMP